MRSLTVFVSSMLLASLPAVGVTHARRGPTSHKLSGKRQARVASRVSARTSGQRSIDDARASQIQLALSNAGYLSGDNSGHWDTTTESAMQKYQADHGWQTKLIPDSRAIIQLGLGPNSSVSE